MQTPLARHNESSFFFLSISLGAPENHSGNKSTDTLAPADDDDERTGKKHLEGAKWGWINGEGVLRALIHLLPLCHTPSL